MNEQNMTTPLMNDLVELSIQYQPHCVIEFSVKASLDLVKNAHKHAMKAVAKKTSLPGFRKGKAPDEIILNHFASDVDKQWQQKIAEEAFREAEKLARIPVLNADSRVGFTMVHHSLTDGAEMKFHFETEPKVPTIDTKTLSLKKEESEVVDQAKIDDTLYQIRLFFAKWQTVTDRPVQEEDFVVINLDLLEEQGPSRVFSGTRLRVKSMEQWMKALVIGMNINESKEGISQPDATASDEDKTLFKAKKVLVTLQSIEEPILPPLDESFASKIGAESVEILSERLQTLLTKQAKEAEQGKYRDQLTALLLEQYQFDLPESLLTKEIQHRLQQIVKAPKFRDWSEEQKQEALTKTKKQAEEALRLFYLCRKIADDNNLKILPSDLNQEIHSTLDAMFADRELSNPHKTEEQKHLLVSRILLEKAQDFLIDQILR